MPDARFSVERVDPRAKPDPELVALVQAAASGPPYDYVAGEIASAAEWVPDLVRRSVSSFLARDADHQAVGYVLVVPLKGYAGTREAAPGLGVELDSTCYLAELGVAPTAQRRGLGRSLVEAAVEGTPDGTTAVAVRTLEKHHTAIRLYQGCGFHLVAGVQQTLRGRPRVFLVRDVEAVQRRR